MSTHTDQTCDYETGRGFCYWRDEVVPQLDRDRAALLEALESTISTLDTCDVPEMANEGDTVFWLERQRSAVDKARAAITLARGGESNG